MEIEVKRKHVFLGIFILSLLLCLLGDEFQINLYTLVAFSILAVFGGAGYLLESYKDK